ncbi:MAG: flagellar basal body P-ring formation chaperone FlgA [Pseudomonadota bacterium]
MTRILLALLLLVAAPAALAGTLPAQLKPTVTVEGDIIHLRDLWDNLGAKGDTPLAAAPQPGKRVVLEARWLAAVAQAYQIDWQPANAFERVVLDRAGQTIDPRAVETEIREALTLEGLPADADIELANRSALSFTIPANVPADIAVHDVAWDPRMNRFSAVVEVPAGSPAATRVRVVGRAYITTRVPVLNRLVARGTVITENDIEWIEVRESQVRADVATSPDQLIGQEPRWQLRQGVPVRLSEVQRPVLVQRNGLVTLVLKTPFMTLTAQGKSTEDGGKGDVIRVTNLQTKRVVEGTVEANGTVSVALGGPLALAN